MDRLIEIKPQVAPLRGHVRVSYRQFGLDGMTEISGSRDAMPPHIALAMGKALIQAAAEIMEAEQEGEVVRLHG